MRTKNTFWILTTVAAIAIGIGGYAVLAQRGILPALTTQRSTTEEATTTPPTVRTPILQPSTPPAKPTTASTYLDIKEIYDTTVAPPIRSDEPRSGTKEVTVRGTLRVIAVEVLCQTKPCPQPDSSDYGFEFLDRYEPTKYRLSVKKTGDPVVKDLTDGEVYVVRGTLNYSFSGTGIPNLSFDPLEVID